MGQQSRIKRARRFLNEVGAQGLGFVATVLTPKQFLRLARYWGMEREYVAPPYPVVTVDGKTVRWNRADRRAFEARMRKAGR